MTTSRLRLTEPQSESYIMTGGQPAGLSWNKVPVWGLRPDLYYCQRVAGLLMWGSLSDERTGLSFTIAAGPRHCRARLPWDSWPYFTVSDSILPFSSSPVTRRVTVEVIDSASTRDIDWTAEWTRCYNLVRTRNTTPLWTVRPLSSAYPLPRESVFTGTVAQQWSLPWQWPVVTDTRLANRCPAVDHSGLQASCHNSLYCLSHAAEEMKWAGHVAHTVGNDECT
jgi:hypothetical protein